MLSERWKKKGGPGAHFMCLSNEDCLFYDFRRLFLSLFFGKVHKKELKRGVKHNSWQNNKEQMNQSTPMLRNEDGKCHKLSALLKTNLRRNM
jgi:hypothetical protein